MRIRWGFGGFGMENRSTSEQREPGSYAAKMEVVWQTYFR